LIFVAARPYFISPHPPALCLVLVIKYLIFLLVIFVVYSVGIAVCALVCMLLGPGMLLGCAYSCMVNDGGHCCGARRLAARV